MDQLNRMPERARHDLPTLHQILAANRVGVLSIVHEARPWSVPLLHARVGDQLILHGSTGAGALRQAAAGTEASYCVWVLDGIVVADTLFDSSATYRSAVLRGPLQVLQGAEAQDALVAMSDVLIPGRSREVPAPTRKELAATMTLALRIGPNNWTAAVQTDGVEEPADPSIWTGLVPVRTTYGPPLPSPWANDVQIPDSVRALCAEPE
ncbi:MAG TPA: pyridoxamine 5'-phosphate oxidase family protein [Marmoricola sp.]|nr:pyridoxamine 5'-phosphate oxidase family protein [Marmoricola sp.]HNI71162.1 pyridoxamine 5'-phosphate oxidase family protein [Marmoricola sp.]HNN47751.1 pyridoxamine 5'-phosphate oxidase family protein [Marmoricola sp.]HNO40766.1 pyridoxamine 5'-phosphate oxidase family protein [Marmoricola sp.]